MKRLMWLAAEYVAFAFWLPAAWVVDMTERVMDASYRRTIPGFDQFRTALDAHTARGDADSAPEGDGAAEGAGGAERGADGFCGRGICHREHGHDGDCDPGTGCGRVTTGCGDRLSGHGTVGPCIRTDRHTEHDDGAGTTWTRTHVPTPQED